jgi:ketosteroid isomerase-like protein
MSSEEANKAVVRRFYAEMDAGNLEAMDQLVAEDYIGRERHRLRRVRR